ncbi:hypothetical protein QTP88_027608 [Uroleucon formosanum]
MLKISTSSSSISEELDDSTTTNCGQVGTESFGKYVSSSSELSIDEILSSSDDYASKNRSQDPKPTHADLTWVNAFCIKLSESLSNSPSLSPLSPSSFQNLNESSLMSCPSIPNPSVISSNGQYSKMECS